MADQTGDGTDRGERNSLDLDALAVSDRFRLFNFTRRDDHVAYLWVLRALDRLRGVHQVQAHTDDVAAALAELGTVYDEVPSLDGALREKLDALAEDGMVHRLEDASRAGSLARYRNRQSVYQFSELGYRAFAAVEDVLSARIRDANLSRLVFSDILDDLKALAAATKAQDLEQVYRRLSRLDTVLDDMSRRAAQFHLTLGEIIRSTDTSPDTFMRYKNAWPPRPARWWPAGWPPPPAATTCSLCALSRMKQAVPFGQKMVSCTCRASSSSSNRPGGDNARGRSGRRGDRAAQ